MLLERCGRPGNQVGRPLDREDPFVSPSDRFRALHASTARKAVKEVNPTEASDLMKKEGYVYIDVRTEPEFAGGHAEGALNIPVFAPGPGGMAPNPDFLSTVKGLFEPGQKMV